MFCPACGRVMTAPPSANVPYPMYLCAVDGIVFDRKRDGWYGLPEIKEKLCCPACGKAMDGEPKEPPIRVFVCYACGTTFDKGRSQWYGLAYHHPT